MKKIVIDARINYNDHTFETTIQPGTIACDQLLGLGRYAEKGKNIVSIELSNPRVEEIEDCLEWLMGKAE